MPKQIAFFDFDGTITRKDSMLELARFYKGTAGYLAGMARLSPSLVLLKLGLLDASTAKEKLLTHFFGGMHRMSFEALCIKFCEQKLPGILRPAAIQKIQEHTGSGHEVVLVSASAEKWLQPFCRQFNITCIGTLLEIEDECITGKLKGANCNGPEKANRIKERYSLAAFEKIYAYGDSSGDLDMLQLAHEKHYRAF